MTGASSRLLVLWEGGSGLAQPVLGAQTHLVPGGLLGGTMNLMGAGLGPDFSVPGAFWGPVAHTHVYPSGENKVPRCFCPTALPCASRFSPMMNRFFPANFPNKQYQLLFTQGSGDSKEGTLVSVGA